MYSLNKNFNTFIRPFSLIKLILLYDVQAVLVTHIYINISIFCKYFECQPITVLNI